MNSSCKIPAILIMNLHQKSCQTWVAFILYFVNIFCVVFVIFIAMWTTFSISEENISTHGSLIIAPQFL